MHTCTVQPHSQKPESFCLLTLILLQESSPAVSAPVEAADPAVTEPHNQAKASAVKGGAAAPDPRAKAESGGSPRQAPLHTAPAQPSPAKQHSAVAQEQRPAVARTGSGPSTAAAGGGRAAATANEVSRHAGRTVFNGTAS